MERIRLTTISASDADSSSTITNRARKIIIITSATNSVLDRFTEINRRYKRTRIFASNDWFFIGFIILEQIWKTIAYYEIRNIRYQTAKL